MKEEVIKMDRMGITEPSTSDYASPSVIVRKQDGSHRYCIDFRRINMVSLTDAEPMPNLLLLESLHDSRPMLGAGSSSGLNSSSSSWVQGCGRMGQTSRCFMICSSPHSHVVCPSSLNPHFCIRDLHLPVPVRRRFRLDQVGHASLEPGGSDSLGLNESLCGVVWRWLDQRFSLRVRALPSMGSTEWRKLCLDLSLFLAGSCSYRRCRGSFSCLSFSSWDETASLI